MKRYLRSLEADDSGAMNEIGLIVGILVTCIVAILVFYKPSRVFKAVDG